ncbi:MAG: hypothetical protein K9N47_20585 [Prosthecobacter sp.]|uniref:hypothetical protein n=1 Tax=Prosthecobacter sp. TaxID=1965333 RepID=UPI0026346170|nr:hypothetical protein [Prosthecobacter sp.]MCF7788531.1 hypothetical protein [Prosthecobacter sp.]
MKKTLVLLLVLAHTAFAEPPTPNEQARFLAGMPQEGSSLAGLAQRGEFNYHAKELDAAWADAEERQLGPIRTWAPLGLPEAVSDTGTLLYVFSGPDFLHAYTFFPNASTYVLAAVEPVGLPPDVTKLTEGELGSSLRNLRNTLNASLSFSFFITADMKKDLQATKLTGTLPVLYVFLARCGCFIQNVENIWLDAEGKVLTEKETKTPGARITFLGARGKQQTLYYFSTNIASWALKQDASFLRFCDGLGVMNGFTKSASYLMHMDEFHTIRDYLLTHCHTMTQDDSGIMWKDFPRDSWDVKAYGWYPGPIPLFKQHYQPDLAEYFRSTEVPVIPFGIGYQWRPKQSTLIYGVSKMMVRKAIPVVEEKPDVPQQ